MNNEVALAEALHRLHTLRVAALTGKKYDPDEFDDAVLTFRQAWQRARERRPSQQRRVA